MCVAVLMPPYLTNLIKFKHQGLIINETCDLLVKKTLENPDKSLTYIQYIRETVDKEAYKKHPHRDLKICQVETVPTISSIRSTCAKRCDKWRKINLYRIDMECDLIPADAQYRKNYNARFSTFGTNIPGKPSENVVGRPVYESKLEAFNKLCNFLDNKYDWQYLLSDLMEILLHFRTVSNKLYSEKRLK
ncbi:hypothetical protein AVEN_144983-1 [Araneus ventricosus]|uniref:Uncharacterized protein n=1 Tax=Araneus ventricosus TaxID=182803 RepID=A0A4Y2PVL0_ARAVE|nr:hypothetical protein AVEN_144983-1 [Araneus ventricosus]